MAQSNSFFGHRRGSTKSLTFQRRAGVQITQDRKEHVRDAKSAGQAQHRCLLHTAVDACSWLAPIFNFAWQNAKGAEAYQSAFRKANYDIVRTAALGGQAGFTYSPYKVKTAPVGYWQVANGTLPYHGNFFKNGINGIDYTETDFLNYTAEGESWYQVLSKAGLKVGDSFILFILFRNPNDGTIYHDIARVILADVPDVTIGQQDAGSLVTIEWIRNAHNWDVINNPTRIVTLRCQHVEFDPSQMVMFTAAFQYQRVKGRTMVSKGFLWHWGDNVDGLSFNKAIVTYPMSEDFTPVMHPVPEEMYVDMGLPSGLLWATRNIDVTQKNGFAASPFQYECSYFSWGNIDGHNPTAPNSFAPWNFGSVNSQQPWYEGQVYGETPGNTLTDNIPVEDKYDAARANLGTPWRMPTNAEYAELFNNIIYINADGEEINTSVTDKRVSINGVVGIYLQSKINGARIFFQCSGNGAGAILNNVGAYGYYWSSSIVSSRNAHNLVFFSEVIMPQTNSSRYGGFAVRPVREPSKRKKSDPDKK